MYVCMYMYVMANISTYLHLCTQDDDPLNSGDDDDSLKSDDEDKFETENIIVCQFDKVRDIYSYVAIQPTVVYSRSSVHVNNRL